MEVLTWFLQKFTGNAGSQVEYLPTHTCQELVSSTGDGLRARACHILLLCSFLVSFVY